MKNNTEGITLKVDQTQDPTADELNAEIERVDDEFVEFIRDEFLS